MAVAVPFPTRQPAGYQWLDNEPQFDASLHLALEDPESILMLSDLGYGPADIEGKATAVAASTPFRVLTDEGAQVMLAVARRLRAFGAPAGDRIETTVRGGCYRSRWLRDLCISPEVTEHFGRIYGTEIAPHPMPLHLGHLNYEPSSPEVSVDKWHHDTLPLDFVLMVTDPNTVNGGEFEYFAGTKAEAAALAAAGETPPRNRVVQPDFPSAGWAIALHGDMVVHRAAPLHELTERITMVNGYVAMDPLLHNQSRCQDLIGVDNPDALYAEWARFAAWRASGRLEHLLDELQYTDDSEAVAAKLEWAIADAQQAVNEMRRGPVATAHYE